MMTRNNTRTLIATMMLVVMVCSSIAAIAAEPKLMAAVFVKGKVGLKWQKASGVSEYFVYRKEAGGNFEKIATTDGDHHFDTTITPGSTYTYKIAVVEGGAEIFSAEKTVTIPGQAGDFKAPTWVGLRVDKNKLYLNWDPVPGAIAYNVWRSEQQGMGYEVVGTSSGSRYVDKDGLVRGATYYYVLSAMNNDFEETPQSEEREVKFGMTAEEVAAAQAEENKVELIPVNLSRTAEMDEGTDGLALNQPSDVGLASNGDIYVSDALNQRVICYAPDGGLKFAFGYKAPSGTGPSDYPDGTFKMPFTLFIDGQDQIYVSDIDRNDIQVFAADGRFVRRIQVDVGVDMNPLRANGLHVMSDGRMVMTDTGNHRVLITDADGVIQKSWGTRGTDEGQFLYPDELAVSDDGFIFVVGPINCRIQQFDLEGKLINAFGEVGQSAGMFARPKGITVGPKGQLWVSDAMSSMIQVFTQQGVIKSAIGTTEDEWQFTTPRGVVVRDGKMLLVERIRNTVNIFSIEP